MSSATVNSNGFVVPDGIATDMSVFTVKSYHDSRGRIPRYQLEVLLIRRKNEPFIGQWSLPGGFVEPGETVEKAALRELQEETGLLPDYLKFFNQYSDPNRDPRGWIISQSFLGMLCEGDSNYLAASDDAVEAKFFPIDTALNMDLSFDHNKILADAYQTIQWNFKHTVDIKYILPQKFTIAELTEVLKVVIPSFSGAKLYHKLLRTSKRKGVIEPVLDASGNEVAVKKFSQRSAVLYKFTDNIPDISVFY